MVQAEEGSPLVLLFSEHMSFILLIVMPPMEISRGYQCP